ncbi:hypothetical protein GUJ93_ZPchr0001g31321 [Zizania palustris]|uniref:Carbamoyl-phosphate synthase (glutamine-hydrolyzing) n=1 Tax=Zizania palustris TaxID=103762 RepID=A0A8J5RTZ8_ZIZPA|nr:hypothetical protein GUJ93_ZPchr0001g31321 [Zizania palustris]
MHNTSQVLVEKSLLGWKEYELEVMRDMADNVVIICSIEDINRMGVHTGDSITVAPAQTLTDKEYQRLRDYSVAIIREIGVECGGSNVQFAVNPVDGEVIVMEMNPRVSRSSALASKATGFPIAKMAAKLSVGYTLDQIPNDITKKTPILLALSLPYDYVVTKAGYETIMMNSNPETVSTDYDTSDCLYFEPLTVEDVTNVIDLERPDGIIMQFGGQTLLKIAPPIQLYLENKKLVSASGIGLVKIWGTSQDSIDAAEDRKRFNAILDELGIEQPKGGIARSESDALSIASKVGYPDVVRPSYVLGGRAMEIVYNDEKLIKYLATAVQVDPERPVLVDKYLIDAIEIDVDALADSAGYVVIGGIMEHIEQAGIHPGDSACSLPTRTVSGKCLDIIRSWTIKLAKRLNVCGLMNCQYAITTSGEVFLLEANPGASRTVSLLSQKQLVIHWQNMHLWELGFNIFATSGTAKVLELEGIPVEPQMPEICLIMGRYRLTLAYMVLIITTVDGARATMDAIKSFKNKSIETLALQDYFKITDASQNLQTAQSTS